MARVTDYARGEDGEILKKTYTIPFRPEYVLIGKPDAPSVIDTVSIAQPTGRDIPAFRFHLAPEAIKLIMEQDPNVSPVGGYCSLSIEFDAAEAGPAIIKATRGVRADETVKA